MLNGLAPLTHLFWMLVEPALHGFEHMLVLPSRDQSFLGGSTAMLDGTTGRLAQPTNFALLSAATIFSRASLASQSVRYPKVIIGAPCRLQMLKPLPAKRSSWVLCTCSKVHPIDLTLCFAKSGRCGLVSTRDETLCSFWLVIGLPSVG